MRFAYRRMRSPTYQPGGRFPWRRSSTPTAPASACALPRMQSPVRSPGGELPWRCRPWPHKLWRGASSGHAAYEFSEASTSLAALAGRLGSRPIHKPARGRRRLLLRLAAPLASGTVLAGGASRRRTRPRVPDCTRSGSTVLVAGRATKEKPGAVAVPGSHRFRGQWVRAWPGSRRSRLTRRMASGGDHRRQARSDPTDRP